MFTVEMYFLHYMLCEFFVCVCVAEEPMTNINKKNEFITNVLDGSENTRVGEAICRMVGIG